MNTLYVLRRLVVETKRAQPLILYLYYDECGEDAPTVEDIRKNTGLSSEMLANTKKALEHIGAITIDTLAKNRQKVYTQEVLPSSFSFQSSLSFLYTIYSTYRSKKEERDPKNWKLHDIELDPQWIEAKAILLKYFHPSFIRAEFLTKKRLFSKLLEVMEDVDLEEYAKWYRANKYPYKKFNFGLFLYPGVVQEFQLEGAPDPYNDTNSQSTVEMFEKLAKEKNKFLIVETKDE